MPIGQTLDKGRIGNTRWDDLSVAAALAKQGDNLKPDFDYTNLGLLFPKNDTSEKAYLTFQMSHKKKLGTEVRLHFHFVQTGSAKAVFRCIYRFYNNGGLVPAFSSPIATNETGGSQGSYPWVSGSLLNVASFPVIVAPTDEGLSSNLDVVLYRDDNVVTGDVLVKFIDAHYEIDTDGSQEEFVK
jgi:hypothetical protein